MDFKGQIGKLQGANDWNKWRKQVELLLRHQEVLEVVDGSRVLPPEPEEDATSEILSKYEADVKAFRKDDALAQLILVGAMNEANADLTATCDSAKTLWDKLTFLYEQSSGQKLDRLMESFFNCRKKASENITTYISRLQRIFGELNDELKGLAANPLPELLLMGRLMSTLPVEYFEFKSVWESVPIEERAMNKLTERLRLMEMRLPSKGSELAKSNNNEAKAVKCYNCHKFGHYANNCHKPSFDGGLNSALNLKTNRFTSDPSLCKKDNRRVPDKKTADSGAFTNVMGEKKYFHHQKQQGEAGKGFHPPSPLFSDDQFVIVPKPKNKGKLINKTKSVFPQ